MPHLENPLRQLELLLLPFGIKTVTTGGQEVEDFFHLRFGTSNLKAVREAFLDNLKRVFCADAVILGVPTDNGAGFDRGSKKGPLGIRRHLYSQKSILEIFESKKIIDIGDCRDHPLLLHDSIILPSVIDQVRKSRYGDCLEEARALDLPVSSHSILHRVLSCIRRINPKAKVLVFGGDHSHSQVPADVLAQNNDSKDLGVLQIDAHTDLLASRDGISFSYACWAHHANKAVGSGGRFIQVGVRTSGRERGDWEKSLDLKQYWASEANSTDPIDFAKRILEDFDHAGVQRIYLSHDIDGLSKEFAGATGTPEPEGLEPHWVSDFLSHISEGIEIVGSDLMEVAPTLSRNIPGEPERTLQAAAHMAYLQLEMMLGGDWPTNPFPFHPALNLGSR